MRCLLSVVAALLLLSCDPPPAEGCAPACATKEPACDDGCPAVALEVCVDGSCEAVKDASVALAVDASIGRDVDDVVVALVVAVVDGRVAACGEVGAVKDADNVVAGNRVAVSGGSFHQDLPIGGNVPAGAVVVAIDAVDADDVVVASGCASAVAGDGERVLVLVEGAPGSA